LNLLIALTDSSERRFEAIERRLDDAAIEPVYDATRMNRMRAEIGWAQ
jgi:hypothetical protein